MMNTGLIQSEFYETKIKNLTQDNMLLHGENSALRKQIREAEEYKIRYELLTQTFEKEVKELKNKHEKNLKIQKEQVIASVFKEKEEKWKKQLLQIESKLKEEVQTTVDNLKQENTELRAKVEGFQKRNEEMELYGFKMKRYEKENEGLKERIEELKSSYEKQKEEQLSSLRNHLTASFREKMANARSAFDIKLTDLQKKLTDAQTEKDNKQFQLPKSKTNQDESQSKILHDKHKQYEEELLSLSQTLQNKNQEIKVLLQQKLNLQNLHREQINEKRTQIDELENLIMQKEKKHQNELYNAIQRANATKQFEVNEIMKENEEIKEMLERERSIWNDKVLNHDHEMEESKKRFEEEKKKILDEKNVHKRRISELSIKLKEAEGDRQLGETQMLINSIRDLDGKQDQLGGYENGIVFLERQLKKCQIKLEEKSSLINKLYKDINQIRGEMDQQLQELKDKFKVEKRQWTQKIVDLQNENKSLFDKIRLREKENKKRERQTFKEKTELEENNKALKELVEQLQRDYKRVVQAKKGAESSYRSERQKNLTHSTDNSALKKQKWLQLQKQKNELQIIFRDKEEQLKLQTQQEVDEKNNLIDKLKMELEVTKNQNELLKAENQKFSEEIEANKQNNRLADYHKKIASLNLELALTQNIYQSLIKAKMDVPRENMSESLGGIEVKHEEDHHDQERNELLMSFCPEQYRQKKK